ncbi:Uncharacterised protein [Burkholderia pseudomallei]|nr:Uncharacterised protein [Burkholderia pseudomallei]CAJ3920109.1 Uncharacterised protein [Burkholderia pseudomallei]CAJ4525182.1 Uncharacterised protein [Burkholderia pseudomallei]CAJ4627454.1 Uncharacterised protein [Burkholderia pseudomallei]CAJ5911494.1 Uncharacterised protein [Burkholderia pseudomallei]
MASAAASRHARAAPAPDAARAPTRLNGSIRVAPSVVLTTGLPRAIRHPPSSPRRHAPVGDAPPFPAPRSSVLVAGVRSSMDGPPAGDIAGVVGVVGVVGVADSAGGIGASPRVPSAAGEPGAPLFEVRATDTGDFTTVVCPPVRTGAGPFASGAAGRVCDGSYAPMRSSSAPIILPRSPTSLSSPSRFTFTLFSL